jgi:hypothetical protein
LDHGRISSVHSVFPNVFLASAMNVTFLIRLPHETLKKASVEETVLTNFVEQTSWNLPALQTCQEFTPT